MEEPALLTDEELAFIQRLYNQPENEQHGALPVQNDLEDSLNDLLGSYANLESISIDVRMVNHHGNVQSTFPVYTRSGNPVFCQGIQDEIALQLHTQERVKQLEAEVALLKTRLTDSFT